MMSTERTMLEFYQRLLNHPDYSGCGVRLSEEEALSLLDGPLQEALYLLAGPVPPVRGYRSAKPMLPAR